MNQSPTSFDLACSCKVGRILAGHDCGVPRWPLPALTIAEQPTLLAKIELDAANAALKRNGGNKTAAAKELGIMRQTLHDILNRNGAKVKRMPGNVIQLAQACAAFVLGLFLLGCQSPAPLGNNGRPQGPSSVPPRESAAAQPTLAVRPLPPLPQQSYTFLGTDSAGAPLAFAPVREKTNGVVYITFDPDTPPETFLLNKDTGIVYDAGTNISMTIGGVRVGTNSFVAFNQIETPSGVKKWFSETVTAVVQSDTNKLTHYGSLWRWNGGPGILQHSIDGVTFTNVRAIPAGAVIFQTNNQSSGFLRVKL